MTIYEITGIVANVCIIVISTWLIVGYFRVKKYTNKYMDDDIDKILDILEQPSNEAAGVEVSPIRERLIAVAASGNAK